MTPLIIDVTLDVYVQEAEFHTHINDSTPCTSQVIEAASGSLILFLIFHAYLLQRAAKSLEARVLAVVQQRYCAR